jgi:hypothetical protein
LLVYRLKNLEIKKCILKRETNHLDRLVDKKIWSHIFSSTIFFYFLFKKSEAQVLAPKTLNKDKNIVVAHGWNHF